MGQSGNMWFYYPLYGFHEMMGGWAEYGGVSSALVLTRLEEAVEDPT